MDMLGATIDTVGGIWDFGSSIYNESKKILISEIDEETHIRVRKKLGDSVSQNNSQYIDTFSSERKIVKRETKEMAGKGALMLLGFGLLF